MPATMDQRRLRRQSSAVTIREVAARAGVSTMTVSRVINNERNVRASTRAAVEAAITALSYAPNPAAQSLAGADRMRIGLLYSNPSSAYLSEFLLGGLDQVSRTNVGLVVEKCDDNATAMIAAERLIADRIDGVVLPPPLCDAVDVIALLQARGVPAIAVASGTPAPGVSSIGIDDRAAARAMTAHLIALGHARIGFIAGNPNQTASALRRAGYQDAHVAAGLMPDPTLEAAGSFSYRSGLEAAEQLLALAPRPTAIFASNDDMAAAAIAIAHRGGLDVPRDLTVCGFDDTAIATTVWPELSTIRQPIAAMSRAAVEMLYDEIRAARSGDRPAPRHVILDYALIERDSDGPPRTD